MAKHPHLFEKEIKGLSPRTPGVELTGSSNAIVSAITGISNDFPHTNPRNAYLYEKLLKAYTKTLVTSTDFEFGDTAEHQNFFPGQFTSRIGPSPRKFILAGASGGLNGVYEKIGQVYRQIDGSGYVSEKYDNSVGTEDDPTLVEYQWQMDGLSSTTAVFSTHSRTRNDSNPRVLQPYEIGAGGGVTIVETGKSLSTVFFNTDLYADTGNSFFGADSNIQL